AERPHRLDVGELGLRGERPGDDDLAMAAGDGGELAAKLVFSRAQEPRARLAAVEVDVDEVALGLEIRAELALAGAGRAGDQQEPGAGCPPPARDRKKSMDR